MNTIYLPSSFIKYSKKEKEYTTTSFWSYLSHYSPNFP